MTFDSVPKIIACGCFRSGTTILAKMLSAHPEILFTSEMYSFKPDWQKHFLKKVNRLHTAEPVDVDKLDSIYSSSFVSKEDMSKFLSLAIDLDNVEKILSLLYDFASKHKKIRYYGDKWPEYVFQLKQTLRRESEIKKIIFCVRDPRDIIESQIRNYWRGITEGLTSEQMRIIHPWRKPHVHACITQPYNWLRYMKAWDNNKRDLKVDFYELMYHRLAENKQTVASELAGFLGVSATPMIEIFKKMFNPVRHEAWRNSLPNLTAALPKTWLDMMNKYHLKV